MSNDLLPFDYETDGGAMDREIAEAIAAMADHDFMDGADFRIGEDPLDAAVTALYRLARHWDRHQPTEDGPFVHVSGDRVYGAPDFPLGLARLLLLHAEKQRQYRGTNPDPYVNYVRAGQSIGVQGWQAALMRLNEKVHRANTLLPETTVLPSDITDTTDDIAVIALLIGTMRERGL